MSGSFNIYVITSPEMVPDEARKIESLLDSGVSYVHIRKPDWSIRDVKNLIESIGYKYRRFLKLHGHFEILYEMNLGGVHLNHRNPVAPPVALEVSRSVHSLEELKNCEDYAYISLSPIFNSISKKGYNAAFDLNNINEIIKDKNIVALGGITPEKFLFLRELGFSGAMLLGYIWDNDFEVSLSKLKESISEIRM